MTTADTAAPTAWADQLVVFDLETTGIDPFAARIVTAYVGVLGPDGEVIKERSWIVDPGVDIPEAAASVHGITTERAREEGADAATSVAELRELIAGCFERGLAVCAFNAAYDFTLLDAECRRHGIEPVIAMPVIDPMILDKHIDKYRKGKRTLQATSAVYGVALTDAHEASADAIAAGRIAQAMARRTPSLGGDATVLHQRTARWADEQAVRFEEWKRNSDPSFRAERGWPIRSPRW